MMVMLLPVLIPVIIQEECPPTGLLIIWNVS